MLGLYNLTVLQSRKTNYLEVHTRRYLCNDHCLKDDSKNLAQINSLQRLCYVTVASLYTDK